MSKLSTPSCSFDPDSLVSGSAKAALTAVSATKGDLYWANPDDLREIPNFNVRIETPDYLEHVEDIAVSIMQNGFYPNKPLGGFIGKEDGKDVIFVTDGHTRRRAVARARELGAELTQVPVVLKAAGTSVEDLTVALIQDNEGRPLSMMEKAIVAARLKAFNWTNVQIAEKLNRTDRHVEDLLVLAGAPKKVRDFVISGKVSPTEAVKQVRKNAERAADVLLVAVQTAGASGKAKASAKHVKAAKGEVSSEKFSFGWAKGAVVPVEDIVAVGRLGSDWWKFVDEETRDTVEILEDVTITATVAITKAVTVSADEEISVAPKVAAEPKAKAAPKAKKAAPVKAKAKGAPKGRPEVEVSAPKAKATPKAKKPAPATADEFSGL